MSTTTRYSFSYRETATGGYTLDERNLERIRRQAEREDGQLLILPSETEEAGALSSPTNDLSSDRKVTNNSSNDQEVSGRKVPRTIQAERA